MSIPITHLLLLPEEIVEQIILKLPSKPLIRFKSLSKTWLSLISTPQFLAKHLLPDRRDYGKLLLVKRRHKTNTRDHVFSVLSHHKLTPTRLLPYPEPDPDPEELSPPQIHISGPWVLPYPDLPINPSFPHYLGADISILGPCNGLVCLFDAGHRYIILRSSFAGELKILPDSDVPDPPGYRAGGPILGFGFDAVTEDYKVIRISELEDDDDSYTRLEYRKVEIYSFNADRWKGNYTRELEFGTEGRLTDPSVAYVDGVMMWLAYKSDVQGCIIWFRMSDESFGETLLPSDAEIDRVAAPFDPAGERRYECDPWWKRLLFLMNDKTVALVVYDSMLERVDTCFHLWVLLEFGVEDSWTRLFTVGPLTGIERPLWFCNTGMMIMETGEGGLVFYDPFTKEMTPLNIGGYEMTLQIISIEERYIF